MAGVRSHKLQGKTGMAQVVIDGVEYVPRAEIPELTDERLKAALKELVSLHYFGDWHKAKPRTWDVVDCGPVMISALYGVPHFVSIFGEDITAERAIELIEGREPGRQYVMGQIMPDGSISVESTSSPHREWDLERVKEANAEWECKSPFALFELVRVAEPYDS
jgi:hypothetical protein